MREQLSVADTLTRHDPARSRSTARGQIQEVAMSAQSRFRISINGGKFQTEVPFPVTIDLDSLR